MNTTNTNSSTGSRPTHRLFQVEGNGSTARWTEIGAAWPNKDGLGFTLSVQAVPLEGRMVLRAIRPAKQAEARLL